MRRISQYIHQKPQWPSFSWDLEALATTLAEARHKQGRVLGLMEALGFNLRAEANLHVITLDVIKSSEIEGEILNPEQVRSSVARRLGLEISGLVPSDRHIEGIVEMMMDATQNFKQPLTKDRLFGWHAAMFPTGRSGMQKIKVGAWRDNTADDPMRVVSGPMGKEQVHFVAPESPLLETEMKVFLEWFNKPIIIDPVLKAAVAHLWFVTIHPFDDGNGRIARAIGDMLLARADQTPQRYYSMTSQIRKERSDYYNMLEKTQKGSLDITAWIDWFLGCLSRALEVTEDTLHSVLRKSEFWRQHNRKQLNTRQQLMLDKLMEDISKNSLYPSLLEKGEGLRPSEGKVFRDAPDSFEGKLTSMKWAKIAKVSPDTALRDIQDLMKQEILEKDPAGGRSSSYLLKW